MTLRYRAVLFDLDGTLVDSYTALAEAVNYARREHGLQELSEARIREFVGDGLEKLLQRAFESLQSAFHEFRSPGMARGSQVFSSGCRGDVACADQVR